MSLIFSAFLTATENLLTTSILIFGLESSRNPSVTFLQLFTGGGGLLDWEVADTLNAFFDSIDNVVYDIDSEKLEKLYEAHGKEFINRVGTCALIMKE